MGCTQSKIENEEAVARCKERKLYMKEAVSARNAFAAAHSAYTMSLKNTGAALSDYAHGEVQNPHNMAPLSGGANPGQGFDSLPPPPPPLPNFTAPPLQRATSMPEIKLSKPEPKAMGPTTIEEGDEEEEDEGSSSLRRRSSRQGSSRSRRREVVEDEDDVPPPAPPAAAVESRTIPPPQHAMGWDDYFFPPMDNIPGPTLSTVNEEVRINNDEIERKAFEERPKRVEQSEPPPPPQVKVPEKVVELPMPPVPPAPEEAAAAAAAAVKSAKRGKQGAGSGQIVEGKRAAKANINLLQIFIDLDDHFLKASESAHEVSKMLEATRLHYHSNFADNRGHIDHSARVMKVITWNRSFRNLPNNEEQKDDFDSEEQETHATVLDKLLAWEKKLYDEVKAGELMKYEYQRKVALLNKQKKRGSRSESLEKTKAAVSHLHTRYIVDMQSMDSTVSEINRLRDEQLYPKLVQLVDGMATMWEKMRVEHENQSKIVTALRALNVSQSLKETSEHHHERTIQLWVVVQEWHTQFAKLVDHQKEYIRSLNQWLKLNLIPIESNLKEKVSSPPRIQNPPIQSLLHAWHDHLDKLPDELARSAIHNFSALINTIVLHQEDEMKLKAKCEDTRKELARKTQQFNEWHRKFVERRIPDGGEEGGGGNDENAHNEAIVERKFVVDALQKRLEEDEAEYEKQCLQVREKSLTSLRTRLPELFRAMSDFAHACSDMYSDLKDLSRP